MAYEGDQLKISGLKAGADLSAAQYMFVKLNADNQVILCAAATDIPLGVLQNKPDASGKAAEVCCVGLTKLSSDEALTAGWLVGTSADGQADRKIAGTDTTNYVVGHVVVGTGAAAGLATAFVNCASPHRGA